MALTEETIGRKQIKMFPLSNITYLLCNNPEYFISEHFLYLQSHSSCQYDSSLLAFPKAYVAVKYKSQGCSHQLLLHSALARLLLYTITTSFLKQQKYPKHHTHRTSSQRPVLAVHKQLPPRSTTPWPGTWFPLDDGLLSIQVCLFPDLLLSLERLAGTGVPSPVAISRYYGTGNSPFQPDSVSPPDIQPTKFYLKV